MLVWLTDWQIAEDHLFIRVGDTVDWTVYPADRDWVSRLFGHRLVIDWQFDSYGDALDQPSRRVSGKVAELCSVHCRQTRAREGLVPVTGEATLQPVADTTGSWLRYTAQEETSPTLALPRKCTRSRTRGPLTASRPTISTVMSYHSQTATKRIAPS